MKVFFRKNFRKMFLLDYTIHKIFLGGFSWNFELALDFLIFFWFLNVFFEICKKIFWNHHLFMETIAVFLAITFSILNQFNQLLYQLKALNVRIILAIKIDLIRSSNKKLYLNNCSES